MNDLTISQMSTILNEIVGQATGATGAAALDGSNFVTVAQTALLSGYDPVIQSISQVLSRTLFRSRPYNRKFGGLEVSNIKYGNHVRKLQVSDFEWVDDDRLPLTDGTAPDMFEVHKPVVLQTNFYGENMYQTPPITVFRDQLDTAFSSAEEFGRFISMLMQNVSNQLEQARESAARAALVNYLAGVIDIASTTNVIHLMSEYNAISGADLTNTPSGVMPNSLWNVDNFVPFIKWAHSRISQLSALMTERSLIFHQNFTGKPIMRHTPVNKQKVFLKADFLAQIASMVRSDVYHDNYLNLAYNEGVNFWQSITNPNTINFTPVHTNATGAITTGAAVNNNFIVGCIIDEEAVGYTIVNQWAAPTPFNARGGYTNYFWHETYRYWNDFTENGVVLILD